MRPLQQAKAECTVEIQAFNPNTGEFTWEPHETMTIEAPNIERLMERAHLYVGRPERHENVHAIRLTGTMTVTNHEKDAFFDHEDTITLDLNILRERTEPIARAADLASGQ